MRYLLLLLCFVSYSTANEYISIFDHTTRVMEACLLSNGEYIDITSEVTLKGQNEDVITFLDNLKEQLSLKFIGDKLEISLCGIGKGYWYTSPRNLKIYTQVNSKKWITIKFESQSLFINGIKLDINVPNKPIRLKVQTKGNVLIASKQL